MRTYDHAAQSQKAGPAHTSGFEAFAGVAREDVLARGEYYLVDGDFTGSWKHVPKDLIIAVWGGAPREKSLRFFSDEGYRTLVACYYDADDLDDVKSWIRVARETPNVRGMMYTPWQKKYGLLPQFGDLLRQ